LECRLTFFSRASRMRTHGFGTMAELVRDIGYQNIEKRRSKNVQKRPVLKL